MSDKEIALALTQMTIDLEKLKQSNSPTPKEHKFSEMVQESYKVHYEFIRRF